MASERTLENKILDIDERLRSIFDAYVDEETGEISDEGVKAIDEIEMEKEDLLIGLACLYKERGIEEKIIDGSIAGLKDEMSRWRRRKDIVDKVRRGIKQIIWSHTHRERKDLKEPGRATIYWTSSQAVQIESEDEIIAGLETVAYLAIPEAWRPFVKLQVGLSKTTLGDAIKAHREAVVASDPSGLLPDEVNDAVTLKSTDLVGIR